MPPQTSEVAMANDHGDGNSGMALTNYTKSTPPGWRAGLSDYPLKRYLELLEIWANITDLDAAKIGASVAGRLGGRVQTFSAFIPAYPAPTMQRLYRDRTHFLRTNKGGKLLRGSKYCK